MPVLFCQCYGQSQQLFALFHEAGAEEWPWEAGFCIPLQMG